MGRFYDTNALLDLSYKLNKLDKFYVSSITLTELENIKTNRNKTEDIKYKVRYISRILRDNPKIYECIIVQTKHYELLEELELDNSNDNLIMACAKLLNDDIVFITSDICCYNIGKKIFNLNVEILKDEFDEDYKGYIVKQFNDNELAEFYQYELNKNSYNLLLNQYLLIKDKEDKYIDAYRWNGEKLIQANSKNMNSLALGNVKPLDKFQMCVFDSFQNNQITMVKGKAGSGKSYLSMGFLFSQLEKHKIDKIIIFTNPIATRGAAKLGYYPGSKNEKLCDSNIGNFLASKLGDKGAIQIYLQSEKIILLPLSDIRGYDTSGMRAGIYITEAQNMNIELMKLALQRIGQDCICIIDGDYNTQVDDISYSGLNNGMKRVSEVFRGESLYGEIELSNIYRSQIAKIAQRM